jgi:hypothetical protein
MKELFIGLSLFVSSLAFASQTPKCRMTIEQIALEAINLQPGFNGVSNETRTTGPHKILNISSLLETYIVAASDEVEPSDWIVVVNPNRSCELKYIGLANDATGVGIWID